MSHRYAHERLAAALASAIPLPPAGDIVLRHRLSGAVWLTFALIFATSAAIHGFGLAPLPLGLIGLMCGLEIVLTVPYRRWLRSGRALGCLLLTGFLTDVAAAAAFFHFGKVVAPIHLVLLMAIVPAALCSPRFGALVLVASAIVHVATTDAAGGSSDVALPLALFLFTGFQCLRYGGVLTTKAKEASEESRVSASLLRVSGELALATSSASVLQRLGELTCELAHADYATVLLRDPQRDSYRAMAVRADGAAPEEFRTLELRADELPIARLMAAADTGVQAASPADAGLPGWAIAPWWQGALVAAALVRGNEPVGVLIAGRRRLGRGFGPLDRRLVVDLAHAGVLALENARLVEDLRAASALKSEFIGTISHEFRSPLHAIIGFVDILHDEADTTPVEAAELDPRAMLRRVRAHACALLETIEATLTVSRLESGRLPLRCEPLAVEPFVSALRAELPETWAKAGVRLEWNVPAGLPVVQTDGAKLKIVVRNLVHNAIKFTDSGRVRVSVALDDGDGDADAPMRLRVSVEDTGVGIPDDMRETIFEMFRQVDGSDTRRHGGVGLGLYIAKRFVEAQGGTIALASTPGAGSRFDVILPVRVAEPAPPPGRTTALAAYA